MKNGEKIFGRPPPQKKIKKIKKSELSEMARTLIEKSDDDDDGSLGGNLGFLCAQTREARTPLGVRQYLLGCRCQTCCSTNHESNNCRKVQAFALSQVFWNVDKDPKLSITCDHILYNSTELSYNILHRHIYLNSRHYLMFHFSGSVSWAGSYSQQPYLPRR
jgi:hypothetical protein